MFMLFSNILCGELSSSSVPCLVLFYLESPIDLNIDQDYSDSRTLQAVKSSSSRSIYDLDLYDITSDLLLLFFYILSLFYILIHIFYIFFIFGHVVIFPPGCFHLSKTNPLRCGSWGLAPPAGRAPSPQLLAPVANW